MSPKQKRELTSAAEPPHKPFQDAYWVYFQDLNNAWYNTQQRLCNVQFEYQRQIRQAYQTPQEKDLQAVQEDYQRALQSALSDTDPAKSFADAFTRYKKAVQDAIASIDVEALDPTIIAGIGQSLCAVAQFARQLDWLPQTTTAADADKAGTQ
jgi:hypothetical protein